MPIPRILHQTWRTEDVPRKLTEFQTIWRELHPDWEYIFWTDETSRAFIAQHHAWLLPVYDAYDVPIKRVDAARYLWMHHYGGVYVDMDMEPVRSLDELLRASHSELVMVTEPEEHCEFHGERPILSNAFLASAAQHPVWSRVLTLLFERRDWPDPLSATGPFLLTDLYKSSQEFRSSVCLLDPVTINPFSKFETWRAAENKIPGTLRDRVSPETFAIHHWVGSWWR